jgi:hypothetical protein
MNARPGIVHADDADVLDLTCEDCGNAKSCAERTATTGICAYCLNERVTLLRAKYRDRYRRRSDA